MATPIPQNRAQFSLGELCRAVGTQAMTGWPLERSVCGVTTDSRGEVTDKLFVALVGERFDGHAHVANAVAAGAAAVLVERRVGVDVPELVVPSTLSALGAIAASFRGRSSKPVIGIGGAAGKTTTRALTQALLRQELGDVVLATPGNLNNRVGVPMVLLLREPRHEVSVLEIGTNQPGEIRALTEVARPDVALLTLIALEHTEGLGDLDGVEREEAELFGQGPEVAIGNGDDPRVRRVLAGAAAKTKLRYGFAEDCDYRIEALVQSAGHSRLEATTPHGRHSFELPWLPRTAALASMGALAAAESALGRAISHEAVSQALAAGAWQEPGRYSVRPLLDGSLLVDDSYNSNPPSLRAALSSTRELAEARGSAFHLVLGEMRELGSLSAQEHLAIGREAAALGAASLTAIAGDARRFLAPERSVAGRVEAFFEDSQSAVAHVLALVRPGDVVLVKGSRGVRSEVVVDALVSARGEQRPE